MQLRKRINVDGPKLVKNEEDVAAACKAVEELQLSVQLLNSMYQKLLVDMENERAAALTVAEVRFSVHFRPVPLAPCRLPVPLAFCFCPSNMLCSRPAPFLFCVWGQERDAIANKVSLQIRRTRALARENDRQKELLLRLSSAHTLLQEEHHTCRARMDAAVAADTKDVLAVAAAEKQALTAELHRLQDEVSDKATLQAALLSKSRQLSDAHGMVAELREKIEALQSPSHDTLDSKISTGFSRLLSIVDGLDDAMAPSRSPSHRRGPAPPIP